MGEKLREMKKLGRRILDENREPINTALNWITLLKRRERKRERALFKQLVQSQIDKDEHAEVKE